MTEATKQELKHDFVKRRVNLRKLRLSKEITIDQMAKAINISSRQYSLKEKGEYPFKDYEMLIISKVLQVPVQKLFFE
ncbi:hypothetical protein AKUA2003_PHAGE200070 (plasmid) [Apilactobacillus kunkeei]|nr:hypothetical protein AKUA2003_PHAGE200070 [Apilactobacillus kunkeei]CAI2669954.1 hypothetical protein AKUA1001_PHAGE200070 [Apilactobacillus kunkeei]CAI2803555.1 hypothetical protein AKUA2002_PHAGE200070 [Apilactobacillus kunkeei]